MFWRAGGGGIYFFLFFFYFFEFFFSQNLLDNFFFFSLLFSLSFYAIFFFQCSLSCFVKEPQRTRVANLFVKYAGMRRKKISLFSIFCFCFQYWYVRVSFFSNFLFCFQLCFLFSFSQKEQKIFISTTGAFFFEFKRKRKERMILQSSHFWFFHLSTLWQLSTSALNFFFP